MRWLAVLGVLVVVSGLAAVPAAAIPVDVTNPSAPVPFKTGETATVELRLTPGEKGVKGYSVFLEVSDLADIVVDSCVVPAGAGASPICTPGEKKLNFAQLDFDPQRDASFLFATVTLTIPFGARLGAALVLTEESTLTTGDFQEVVLSRHLIGTVIPEPGTVLLVGLGLAACAARGRRS